VAQKVGTPVVRTAQAKQTMQRIFQGGGKDSVTSGSLSLTVAA